MCRKIFAPLLVALVCLLLARPGKGQDETESRPRRDPTLGERLGQFRDELLGEPRSRKRRTNENSNKPRSEAADGSDSAHSDSTPDDNDSASEPARSERRPAPAPSARAPQPPATSSRRTALPEYQAARRADPNAAPADRTAVPVKRLEPTLATPAASGPNDRPATLQERLSAVRQGAPPMSALRKEGSSSDVPAARVARLDKGTALPGNANAAEKLPEHSITRAASDNLLFSGQSPLLSVEAAGPRKIMIGREAAFAVKIRNAGDAAANNVVVTINIPAFAELAGSQASSGAVRAPAGSEHREPMEWKITRLEPHSRETLSLRLVPRKSIPLDLAVQWTCSPDVTQTLVEVQEPKLMMALSGPEEIFYGKSKIYKLTISNPGNGDAENVLVSLQPVGRATEAAASHRLGTIRAGASKAIEVELTARQVGVLMIRAQAFADGGLRAEAAEQVLVRRATIKIDTEAPRVKYAGTNGTYRIRLTNSGNAVAQNVRLAALLPPDAKFVSGDAGARLEANRGKVYWTAGNLQPGADRVFEMQCALNAPGDNLVQFSAMADDDVSGSATTTTRVEAMADLKLEVRDPQGPVPVGEDTVYEVVIRNRGTKSAEGVELIVFFSEGLEATAVQGGAHEIGKGQVVFQPISAIQAASECVMRIHTKAEKSGNHVFRAEVVCQSLETKLAAEETTRFYGEETSGAAPQSTNTPRRHSFEQRDATAGAAEH